MDELGDLLIYLASFAHQLRYLPLSMHDRGVVTAAELAGDSRVAVVGELPEQVHCRLPGSYEGPPPARPADLFDREVESFGRCLQDFIGGHRAGRVVDHVGQDLLGQLGRDGDVVDARVSGEPYECSFELAYVVLDVRCDQL